MYKVHIYFGVLIFSFTYYTELNMTYNIGRFVKRPYRATQSGTNNAKKNFIKKSVLIYDNDYVTDTVDKNVIEKGYSIDYQNGSDHINSINGDTKLSYSGSKNTYAISIARPSVVHSLTNRIISH